MNAHTPITQAIAWRNVENVGAALSVLAEYMQSGEWLQVCSDGSFADGLFITAYEWRLCISTLITLGEFKRASSEICNAFGFRSLLICEQPGIEKHCILVSFSIRGLTIFVSPHATSQEFWFVGVRITEMLHYLKFLADNVCRKGEVLIGMGDHGMRGEVSFCSNVSDGDLIPDICFMGTGGYSVDRARSVYNSVPWLLRRKTALWRGATTGTRSPTWMSLPRIHLCQIALETDSSLFDCGINRVVQSIESDEEDQIQRAGLIKFSVPQEQFDRYKYHIDIDGNTNAWQGLFVKLLTGSPVMKVRSAEHFKQWYYDRLTPWYNYVPIEAKMEDLVEKVNWLADNDERAQRIGSAGRRLALEMTLLTEAERTLAVVEHVLRR